LGRVVYSLWKSWENLFRKLARVKPLEENQTYLFHIAKRRYLGRAFTVDGISVKRFDTIVELHMNNQLIERALQDPVNVVVVAVQLLREAKRSLPVLADCVTGPNYHHVQVLLGVTFMHRSVERLGFRTFPIANKSIRLITNWYLRFILSIVNPNAKKLLKSHATEFVPKIVAISKQKLIHEYGHLAVCTS